MKSILLTLCLLGIALLFSESSCRKHHISTPADQLPPATQEGKNTLGFLLNGQPWTPKGFNGTANLSLDYDSGYKNGIFDIAAYKILNNDSHQQFTIGIKDSLNYATIPTIFLIGKNTLLAMSFTNDSCDFFTRDSLTFSSGNLTITKLDKSNGVIISGTFNVTLYKPGCGDTIKITQGRFDMSLH